MRMKTGSQPNTANKLGNDLIVGTSGPSCADTRVFRPDLDPNFSCATIPAPRWRNLIFAKDGKCFVGAYLHATQAIAKRVADAEEAHGRACQAESCRLTWEFADGKTMEFADYHHCLQVPAGHT